MSKQTMTPKEMEAALYASFLVAAKALVDVEIEGEDTAFIACVVNAAQQFADATRNVATVMGVISE